MRPIDCIVSETTDRSFLVPRAAGKVFFFFFLFDLLKVWSHLGKKKKKSEINKS